MEHLIIEKNKNTPQVDFNPTTGLLLLSGNSYFSDSRAFFEQLVNWIHSYADSNPDQIKLEVDLLYFNTGSSIQILNLVKEIGKYQDKNGSIVWKYDEEDEEMLELGQKFSNISGVPIEFISKTEL